jgi:hypothetical protein
MLSILIPIHNYSAIALVKELENQIIGIENTVEIICCDDSSTDEQLKLDNKAFLEAHQIKLIENNSNIGRTRTRQLLAKTATHSWVLFLDVDVIPVLDTFLRTYISFTNNKYDCVYGGLSYKKEYPKKQHMLRWVFGHKREDIALPKRKTTPYKSIASGNLLIKKELFLSINKNLTNNWYGYDNFFSAQLKDMHSSITHINNKVYHLGLEDNLEFLKKQELSTLTIFKLYITNDFSNSHDNGLLNMYLKLEKYRLIYLYSCFYKCFKKLLKRNLLSNSPNLYCLDLYRLGYFCTLNSQKNA